MREHGPYAPAAYPEVHHLTSPLRKAAAKAGDAQGMALWAGQGHRMARPLPAGQLVETLAEELAIASTALSTKAQTQAQTQAQAQAQVKAEGNGGDRGAMR